MSRTVWLKRLPPHLRLLEKVQKDAKKTAETGTKKAPKYKNTKIVNQFGKFDSKREWTRFLYLYAKQQAGLIKNLRRQVKFELVPRVKFKDERRAKPAIRYFADFVYDNEFDQEVIEDVKSEATRKTKDYRLKKHLMKELLQKDIQEV